jgi:hypothetical protein
MSWPRWSNTWRDESEVVYCSNIHRHLETIPYLYTAEHWVALMMTWRKRTAIPFLLSIVFALVAAPSRAQQLRIELTPKMLTNETPVGDPTGIIDEQREIIGPPAGAPTTVWEVDSRHWDQFPVSAYLDLGDEKRLASLWLFDTHGKGDVVISSGRPGHWEHVATYDCAAYMKWVEISLDVTTRYLRLTRMTPGANFSEIAVYEYSDGAYQALQEERAEQAKREAERQELMRQAREEALRRPLVDLPPYGTLSLVDEIDCSLEPIESNFREYPAGVSQVQTIMGRSARVLPPTTDKAAFFTYRIGSNKLLRRGAAYVLTVDYPEDVPRSIVVINTGNETSRGFHTGTTVGDALHAKYVNPLVESLDIPLSGRWETWSLLMRLHDRFPEQGLVRGPQPRTLTPDNGFDVTIAQFSADNMPMSRGAAVSRLQLFEVVDPERLLQPLNLPPAELPRRHLFWREEMADGIIDRKTDLPGIDDPLDWYRHKADLMQFLGMNTYSKDLLEFGACQHWDSTPHGGNAWVYHDSTTRHLWAEIVELMGGYGFTILPYYEYSGSKGAKGLGNQRRSRPLTRDDAYTHIAWVESANADLTDPDSRDDFQKMLDLTVLRLRDKADFLGIWLRSRGQMPISFSDAALARFAADTTREKPVTRPELREDSTLYGQYVDWWEGQRHDFWAAMRDFLLSGGIDDAVVLYTGTSGEPGVPFPTWDPYLVTDRPDLWRPILQRPEHQKGSRGLIQPWTIDNVVDQGLYFQALTSPGLNWGDWEVHHSRPADDPHRYGKTEGVLLTHAFNRNYTVASPETFDAYRTVSGLAIVRHYALNENMMVDQDDQDLLGYFIADIERAGPYCMMGEIMAMAHGDPTMIGYLVGSNFARGFPHYVRQFNANFLALPALPSAVLPDATDDPEVVVRRIDTPAHGSWIALINRSLHGKPQLTITLPDGPWHDAVTDQPLESRSGRITLDMQPCQLRTLHLSPQTTDNEERSEP